MSQAAHYTPMEWPAPKPKYRPFLREPVGFFLDITVGSKALILETQDRANREQQEFLQIPREGLPTHAGHPGPNT
jgi:hypothetical protein